ncbi:MAG: hypothetical protein E7559_00265 [Ruminococcaceae bacterium]|nr:hypothetical protein [Oscillospiraceae bacterium]
MKNWTETDFLSGEVVWLEECREEDMLQVRYPHNYTLDMGWYEGDGKYIIYIIKDHEWGVPVVRYSAESEEDMTVLLQQAAERIEHESQTNKTYYGGLWTTEEISL